MCREYCTVYTTCFISYIIQQAHSETHIFRTHRRQVRATASSSSRGTAAAIVETELGKNSLGNTIKVLESKHGATRYEVWETDRRTGNVQVLGKVGVLLSGGRARYKAICKIHRNCACIISSLDEASVLKWLSVASEKTLTEHQELSKETRLALGMKIRS